jgi:hypothetical protein
LTHIKRQPQTFLCVCPHLRWVKTATKGSSG